MSPNVPTNLRTFVLPALRTRGPVLSLRDKCKKLELVRRVA